MTEINLHANLARAWEVAARMDERVNAFLSAFEHRAGAENYPAHYHEVWDGYLQLMTARGVCRGPATVQERYTALPKRRAMLGICAVLMPRADSPPERCLRVRTGAVELLEVRASNPAQVVTDILEASLHAGLPTARTAQPHAVTGGRGFVIWQPDAGLDLADLDTDTETIVGRAWDSLALLFK